MPRRHILKKHQPYRAPADCSSKTRYRGENEARRAAEIAMLQSPNLELDVYHCNQCRQWHLTSRKALS